LCALQAGLQRPPYNYSLQPRIQPDRIAVVLVSPRNPLNIGAAARAMANFGVRDLRVVTPFARAWREARSAIEAESILDSAREFANLADALAECSLVLGTGTSRYRRPAQPHYFLPRIAQLALTRAAPGERTAIVFGPEKHGLRRDDLSLCHAIVEIPTDPGQPSMNLGQSVAVCLYGLLFPSAEAAVMSGAAQKNEVPGAARVPASFAEDAPAQNLQMPDLSAQESSMPDVSARDSARDALVRDLPVQNLPARSAPSSGDLERLTERILAAARLANYSPPQMEAANREDLRLLLRRWQLTPPDVRRAMGLFRRIEWHLRRARDEDGSGEGSGSS
jgi:tRNA/rRNA methyltransferase